MCIRDRAWTETQWTVLLGYLEQMLAAIKHVAHANSFLSARQYTIHIIQSNCCSVKFSTSFSWAVAPNNPELITRFRDSDRSATMIYESSTLKKSSSRWLKSGKAVVQHLSEQMQFQCFHVLPGSAEASVRQGEKIKHLSIAYFLSNMSPKNYQNWFMYVEVIGRRRFDVLEGHSVYLCQSHFNWKLSTEHTDKHNGTRMWANAQRDGRPAQYRWCPLFNAVKFGWRPLLDAVQ